MTERPEAPEGHEGHEAEERPEAEETLERIAHYDLNSVVAHGGMGIVYRATDKTLDRFVALKVLDDPQRADRLIQEARIVSRLLHPGIAAVYQAGVDDSSGVSFIAFEWVEGSTLRLHLRDEPLPLSTLDDYVEQLASAVAHAHREGLVHGDLKADNVVVNLEGRLKLLDFGLSAPAEGLDDGELWGTPAYMAPELLDGGSRTEATDLFALGVLLFEMATGQLPFGGEDGDEHKVRERLRKDRPDPRQIRPDIPGRVSDIIASLLEADPARRGPSAAEVERFARLRNRGERSSFRWFGVLVLLVLVAAGSWWVRDRFFRGNTEPARGDGLPVAREQPVRLRVGPWRDPVSGEGTEETRFARDLLTLFIHGEDPGSALLTPLELAADEKPAEVTGSWGQVGGGWEARWRGPGEEEDSVARAPDAMALARDVATQLLVAPVRGRIAETVPPRELAVRTFVEGVRAAEAGKFEESQRLFAEARRQAGSFPEATAWEAAARLVLGEVDEATTAILSQGNLRSRPGTVLSAALGSEVRRGERWGRPHRLARAVDLLLSSHEPTTSDVELLTALVAQDDLALPWCLHRRVRLELTAGRPLEAEMVVQRLRAMGDSSWRVVVSERWLRDALEGGSAGDELLSEWILDQGPDAPGGFLSIGLALHKGNLASAARRARRERASSPEARRAVALTLALAGEFEEARRAARAVRQPFDPGLSLRLASGISMLEGDLVSARDALERARVVDPDRPETRFLLHYIDTEPYDLTVAEAPGGSGSSEFSRWRDPFDALAASRASRVSGDTRVARRQLERIRWVGPDLSLLHWPEVGFLGWLEGIACDWHAGDPASAKAEFERFRQWWPSDRSEGSRVSRQARLLEKLLSGSREGGQ